MSAYRSDANDAWNVDNYGNVYWNNAYIPNRVAPIAQQQSYKDCSFAVGSENDCKELKPLPKGRTSPVDAEDVHTPAPLSPQANLIRRLHGCS